MMAVLHSAACLNCPNTLPSLLSLGHPFMRWQPACVSPSRAAQSSFARIVHLASSFRHGFSSPRLLCGLERNREDRHLLSPLATSAPSSSPDPSARVIGNGRHAALAVPSNQHFAMVWQRWPVSCGTGQSAWPVAGQERATPSQPPAYGVCRQGGRPRSALPVEV
jgi:hypothetical protein